MGAKAGKTDTSTEDLPIGDEEIATHQEAVPLPYLAGQRRIAIRWIAGALDVESVQAPDETPGKK